MSSARTCIAKDGARWARVGYDAHMFGLDTIVVLVVVLILVLLWRGPKTLPAWGKSLGRGVRGARKEADEIRSEIEKRDGFGKDKD